MSVHKIEALIEAARNAVEDGFELGAAYEWKKEVVEYLTEQLGADHYYTRYFEAYMKEIEQKNLLMGGGLLTAAKEEIVRKDHVREPLFCSVERSWSSRFSSIEP